MSEYIHETVLLHESVDNLNIRPNGVYVDLTMGGAGHSKLILSKLNEQGMLVVFDQDPDAEINVIQDSRVHFVNQNFQHFGRFLRVLGISKVDGVLADLGMSSFHIDSSTRGFSFTYNTQNSLDMRMNPESDLTASKVLNTYPLDQLTHIFKTYGELKGAHYLAKKITTERQAKTFQTVDDFTNLLEQHYSNKNVKLFAKIFQALRIEVNQELEVLKKMLTQIPNFLRDKESRVAVITFHSLEDYIVKSFFRYGTFDNQPVKDFYGNIITPLERVNKKVITPSKTEIKKNSRARSAKLRVAKIKMDAKREDK